MGTVKRDGRPEPVVLRSRCLFGRSSSCDVRVDDGRVSGEHASVSFTGTAWELRDLGSKNGTFVDARRLAPGEHAVLVRGSAFALGGAAGVAFTLEDEAPPLASARHLASGVVRTESSGFLALPSEDAPRLSVFLGRDGRWTVESDGEVRAGEDREVVVVVGEAWSLDLPTHSGPTLDASAVASAMDEIALRFRVSRDEERVEITVAHQGGEVYMPPRSCHDLLLTLARARLEDAGAGARAADAGWRDREEICRMLAIDEYRLNVDVCRARKQFAAAGLFGGATIVERRQGTGRMRLGVARVEVERAVK